MVLTKTLTYEVLDIDGKPKPNSTISVAWKCSETGAKHLIHKNFCYSKCSTPTRNRVL